MSRTKSDRTFTNNVGLETNAKFSFLIALTLQSEYGHLHSPAKHLAQDMRVSRHTARNWYTGKNLICSRQLVLLAQRSDAIRNLLFSLSTSELDQSSATAVPTSRSFDRQSHPVKSDNSQNEPINDPIKFSSDGVNARQQWFLDQISGSPRITAGDIIQVWNVAPATAKRDIADLRRRGMIVRIGSRKSGRYIAVPAGDEGPRISPSILAEEDPCS
jgi:DNA-binding MarR family transcriptional regulator